MCGGVGRGGRGPGVLSGAEEGAEESELWSCVQAGRPAHRVEVPRLHQHSLRRKGDASAAHRLARALHPAGGRLEHRACPLSSHRTPALQNLGAARRVRTAPQPRTVRPGARARATGAAEGGGRLARAAAHRGAARLHVLLLRPLRSALGRAVGAAKHVRHLRAGHHGCPEQNTERSSDKKSSNARARAARGAPPPSSLRQHAAGLAAHSLTQASATVHHSHALGALSTATSFSSSLPSAATAL